MVGFWNTPPSNTYSVCHYSQWGLHIFPQLKNLLCGDTVSMNRDNEVYAHTLSVTGDLKIKLFESCCIYVPNSFTVMKTIHRLQTTFNTPLVSVVVV